MNNSQFTKMSPKELKEIGYKLKDIFILTREDRENLQKVRRYLKKNYPRCLFRKQGNTYSIYGRIVDDLFRDALLEVGYRKAVEELKDKKRRESK